MKMEMETFFFPGEKKKEDFSIFLLITGQTPPYKLCPSKNGTVERPEKACVMRALRLRNESGVGAPPSGGPAAWAAVGMAGAAPPSSCASMGSGVSAAETAARMGARSTEG